jgi:hypothetical protein
MKASEEIIKVGDKGKNSGRGMQGLELRRRGGDILDTPQSMFEEPSSGSKTTAYAPRFEPSTMISSSSSSVT